MPNLLVVDDEQSICWGLSKMGESLGYQVTTASSAEAALALAAEARPDAIVLDVRLPGLDGLSAMEQLRAEVGDVPMIVITAYGDLQTAVNAVRNGAFDYITKPFSLEQVRHAVLRAVQRPDQGDFGPRRDVPVEGIVGRTPVMQATFNRIALAASADSCVLLSGESGTGKELAARAIHRYSRRADGPFVAVNVAALSPSLAESELFGHERGAFTGAERSRSGLLAQADGGTLFLDEVADIPLSLQVKLLRALDSGEVLPVGGSKPITTNIRVISATHQNLLKKIADGTFRHDLYFRLSAFEIELPPLRERRDDIPDLVRHFVARIRGEAAGDEPEVSRDALAELQRRPWFGNVRELRNVIEHAMIVARGGAILPEHLSPPIAAELVPGLNREAASPGQIGELISAWAKDALQESSPAGQAYNKLLQLVEPPLLKAAMERCGGNCAAAARELGMHRITLSKKLDQYGLR
ncbi:MAG: sigma-54-dependent Fis family transcriptional regulator [Pirellulaceae bacterium]|nr:sigma-54-dependent Fis family transcriptional regulator [Pirellulaceae bacterium]